MREAVFIKRNIDKWREYESLMRSLSYQSTDYLLFLYNDITADLSFAQSHYPNSRITTFLNGLAVQVHNEVYKSKPQSASRLVSFWVHEVPYTVWVHRREMLISLFVFLIAIAIGVVSDLGDNQFARLIMGDAYVDMTENNIRNGVPMGVYDQTDGTIMFLEIALNNVKVAFLTFALGVFTSIATGFVLVTNGVMVGAFNSFFYRQGLLATSLITIMMHGTLELSSIIIAGGAGIVMGNGWLFPGTYGRLASFRRSSMEGLKIAVGVVPVILLAAVIESFITRHVEWPLWIKFSIIGASALLIIFYFVVLPIVEGRRVRNELERP